MSPTDTIPIPISNSNPESSEPGREGEVDVEFTELDLSGRPREKEVGVPKEVVLVDWDGDDDPENPLNWYVHSRRPYTMDLRPRYPRSTPVEQLVSYAYDGV